ncbi:MAG: Flp pilus assembly complex ATPase component TadA [Synergistaceae bacterium]|nr:Flp pilus assembly complex ATPase component TadA [Synergistaceae bacterium]
MTLPEPSQVLSFLPEALSLDALRQQGIVPLRREEGLLIVGASSLEAFPQAQILGASLGVPVELEIHSREDIDGLLRSLYDLRSGIADDDVSAIEGVDDLADLAREDVLSDSVDVPIIRLVNGLIAEAIRERVTDIHIEPYEDSVLVRFRVDGVLHDRLRLPKGHQAPLTSRVKVMARMDIAERFVSQDGRIGITVGGHAIDIRVGAIPTQHGERLALRILDKGQGLLSLEHLGMAERERTLLEAVIRKPHGIVLLTGPTGSGKTTTLYAILQALARPEVNILTVEDPIEYDLPGVAQIQVNEKVGLTFAGALREILRQDPDIIMIGEMRDYETAHIGVQAALTGHLVLSTLHTNDSTSAVTRLIDMGVEPYLLAGSLNGVVAQRLVRRLCPRCRKEEEATGLLRRNGLTRHWTAQGCDHCGGTGYRGRVGLYEQFIVDEVAQEAIAQSLAASQLRAAAVERGLVSLWHLGLEKVAAAMTSIEEVLRVTGEDPS